MGFFAQVLPVVLATLTAVNGAAIKSLPAGAKAIPDSYIVMMKDSLSTKDFDSHRDWVTNLHRKRLARRGDNKFGGIKHTYKFPTGLKGYAGSFDEESIQEIAKRSDVWEPKYPSFLYQIWFLIYICRLNLSSVTRV